MDNYKKQIKILESCINKLHDAEHFFINTNSLDKLHDQTHYESQALEYLINDLAEFKEGISEELIQRIKTNANSYLKIAEAYKKINHIA